MVLGILKKKSHRNPQKSYRKPHKNPAKPHKKPKSYKNLAKILPKPQKYHITPLQMLDFHQSLHRKIGLIIIKVPKAPLHPVPKSCVSPILIPKLTLTSQQ